MKKHTLLYIMLLIGGIAMAQAISEVAPIPAAFSEETPLPEAIAKKKARYHEERAEKFVRQGQKKMPEVHNSLIQFKNEMLRDTKGSNGFEIIIQKPEETYTQYLPISITNSSRGHENIEKGQESFNVKRDRLSSAVIENNEIYVISKHDKRCDMSEFSFKSESEFIEMNGNKIVRKAHPIRMAKADFPETHKVTIVHIKSGAKYTYDIHFSLKSNIVLGGQKDRVLALCEIDGCAQPTGLLCDLTDNSYVRVVSLPVVIDMEGINGRNGHRGANGLNGKNEFSYKDKDGNVHKTAGTCAKPGSDGENGTDGTDGAHALIIVSPKLIANYGLDVIEVEVEAGIGGKGGKGGKGGIHGKGSGCTGKAADGNDGHDGHDGVRGDFLYVEGDVEKYVGYSK